MSKRFSTLETTRIVFQHPKVMFTLIQRMDREKVRFVREHELAHELREYTQSLPARERQRLVMAFSTDNLFQSALVIDIDKVEGERRLVFQDALIGLMRACNASLYQELTDARLRSRLVALWDVEKRLEASSFSDADPDFTELQDDLYEQISNLIGLLRQNILRMQTISGDLAEVSGDASRSPDQFAAFRKDLLDQVARLYERHIKPTLAFLNRDTQLEQGANLFVTLDAVKRLLERNDQMQAADQVFRAGLSLNAMYKPIQQVAWEVDNFLRKTRNSMLQYNAMEHHYGLLRELHETTLTQDLRKTRLDGENFVRRNGFVAGLKQRPRPKSYVFGNSVSYYRMLFAEIELRLADIRRQSQAPVLPEVNVVGDRAKVDAVRTAKLLEWVDALELRPTQDLVRELHGRLQGFIEGYRFADLLMVMNRLSNTLPPDIKLRMLNRFRTLPDESGEVYVYRRRVLEREALHD